MKTKEGSEQKRWPKLYDSGFGQPTKIKTPLSVGVAQKKVFFGVP